MSARVGATAPQYYLLELSACDAGVNLSLVTAQTLKVRRPDGQIVTWSATCLAQTSTSIKLAHEFSPGDLPVRGNYIIYALLTVPDGTLRSEPRTLQIKAEYEI